jgi:uncharacterized protein (TIGR03000 family)
MLRRASATWIVAAVLMLGVQPAAAQAHGILGIVPHVASGIGRALFGPWDRYCYAVVPADVGSNYYYYPQPYSSPSHSITWPYGLAQQPRPEISGAAPSPGYQLAAYRAGSADAMTATDALRAQFAPGDAGIVVFIPPDAKLFVNNTLSSQAGRVRKVFSRNLEPGKRYPYELRAEALRGGRVVSFTKRVELTAGAAEAVQFPTTIEVQKIVLPAQPATTLVVHVPADAKVYLLGNETQATGAVRRFTTDRLPAGERTAYTLRVTIRRGNRLISQERRIILEGGRTHEQRFQFGMVAPGDRVTESDVSPQDKLAGGTLTNPATTVDPLHVFTASDETLQIEE